MHWKLQFIMWLELSKIKVKISRDISGVSPSWMLAVVETFSSCLIVFLFMGYWLMLIVCLVKLMVLSFYGFNYT